jgi:hypothetical protein
MEPSVISDVKRYFGQLHRFLSEHKLIDDPKELKSLVTISKNKNGEIIGWIIHRKEIKFSGFEKLKCDEKAIRNFNEFILNRFSYHFNTKENDELQSYRIDLDSVGLHLNPDPSLEETYGHRVLQTSLTLNLAHFNCLLALHLALQYMKHKIYPACSDGHVYNNVLDGLRRQV